MFFKRNDVTRNGENNQKPSRGQLGLQVILSRSIAIFVAAMLCVLWLCQVVFLDEFYRLIKTGEIRSAAKAVRVLARDGEYGDDVLTAIGESYNVCIDVYLMSENRAQLLGSARVLNRCALHSTDTKSKFLIYSEAVKHDGEYIEYFSFDADNRVYQSVGETAYDGSNELTLIYAEIADGALKPSGMDADAQVLMIVNSTVTPISATVSTIYVLLSVFSVAILVIAIAFSYYISRKIAAPIDRLSAAADEFGKGARGVDFAVGGYTEIDRLSSALSYAASEMEKTERLRRDLLANISHDLRTPITLISGYGEMIRDIPGENTPENLQVIVSEAERLNSLVSELLDYSKLISGALPFDFKEYSLTEQVRSITARYAEMLKSDGYTIVFDSDSDCSVVADEAQISRVLVNYITNAASHSAESKLIRVRQTVEDGWVKIYDDDRGNGIPKEELPEIWERYYKLSRNGSRASKGSGLGLSIVKAIMERHGGAYGVISKLGVGSSFWFALRMK
ncbi:MAG: HAMP domain-containing histidine kinase [Clostridia bacterium]|nr:HAMP domain-containing histidine kinase [Clostridia bacterium]